MTNTELKTILETKGFSTTDLEKIDTCCDAEKITEVVESSNSPKEAFEKIHELYPEIEVAEMEKELDFIQDQLEASWKKAKSEGELELSENELDMVAGGGFFSWMEDNWKNLVLAAGISLVCAGTLASFGLLAGTAVAIGIGASASMGTAGIVGASIGAVIGLGGGVMPFLEDTIRY